jgi:hypothetical protein
MAFILAFLVLAVTLGICAIGLFGAGMSDSPSASEDAEGTIKFVFFVGVTLSVLIAASHWLPHIGW